MQTRILWAVALLALALSIVANVRRPSQAALPGGADVASRVAALEARLASMPGGGAGPPSIADLARMGGPDATPAKPPEPAKRSPPPDPARAAAAVARFISGFAAEARLSPDQKQKLEVLLQERVGKRRAVLDKLERDAVAPDERSATVKAMIEGFRKEERAILSPTQAALLDQRRPDYARAADGRD